MKNILYLIIILAFAAACKKPVTPEPNIDVSNIYGQWTLINRTGGLAATPINYTGTDISIEIKNNNTYTEYRSGVAQTPMDFSLVQSNGMYGTDLYIINVKNYITRAIFKAKRDTLGLNENAADGYYYLYVRHK